MTTISVRNRSVHLRTSIDRLFTELLGAATEMEVGVKRRLEKHAERLADWERDDEDDVPEAALLISRGILDWEATALPRVLRYAAIVSAFSAIEVSLTAVCRELQEQRALPLSVSDLRGTGIERSRLYLAKVAGLDLTSLHASWLALKSWQRVRHCIVHTNGDIGRMSDAASLRNVIDHLGGVTVQHNKWSLGGEIQVADGTCESLIRLGYSFTTEVGKVALGTDSLTMWVT